MNKPIFTVSAKALVATHLFRASDGSGPTSGIHVKPDGQGGSLIFANNGNSCALIHDPFGECLEPVTITPSKSFIAAIKDVAKKPLVVQVSFDGERLSLLLGECAMMDQRDGCKYGSDAIYPDVLSAINKADSLVLTGYRGASLSIPFDSMKPFQDVAKLYGGDDLRTLTLYPSGPASPCIVRMDCNPDFVGQVMPMCTSETGEYVEPESATCRDEPLKGFDSSVLL